MTDTHGSGSDVAASPLGKMLGLNEAEVDALGNVFGEATKSMGIEGGPIFDRLRQGQTLGKALNLPDGIGELLYARAHRWFSLGRIEKAEPLFRALCVIEEASPDYWVGYGVCLRLRQDLKNAGVAFETATRLRPDWDVPHFHLLELALHMQAWEDAERHFQAFEARKSEETPAAIRAEAERLRAAMLVRKEASATPG